MVLMTRLVRVSMMFRVPLKPSSSSTCWPKDGPDLIVWGSSTLAPVLLEHGLADGLAARLGDANSVAVNSFGAIGECANAHVA